jgi:hypothetical protein
VPTARAPVRVQRDQLLTRNAALPSPQASTTSFGLTVAPAQPANVTGRGFAAAVPANAASATAAATRTTGTRAIQPAAGSVCQSWNAVPSLSAQAANQPCPGTGAFSSATPPSVRTVAIEASMSSHAK